MTNEPLWMAGGTLTDEDIAERKNVIYRTTLEQSRHFDGGNFEQIHPDDLELLFEQYDHHFFEGQCRQQLGHRPLRFRLSSRMTRAGGKTAHAISRSPHRRESFEIAISTTLLFQTFNDVERTITVTGCECHDRLEALQRIFEHELIHLLEMATWKKSSCSQRRFQTLAHRFFSHTEHTHALITPRERALKRFGIRAGSRVRFRFDGTELVGLVNRITRRATVLVEAPHGQLFSDGKRYETYYMPLNMLESLDNT